MGDKYIRVIRITDAPPPGCEYMDPSFYLEKAVFDYALETWDMCWICEDGHPVSFSRRCDASRWAGRYYPDWERQHWYLM
jgi:hypothetical protein